VSKSASSIEISLAKQLFVLEKSAQRPLSGLPGQIRIEFADFTRTHQYGMDLLDRAKKAPR